MFLVIIYIVVIAASFNLAMKRYHEFKERHSTEATECRLAAYLLLNK